MYRHELKMTAFKWWAPQVCRATNSSTARKWNLFCFPSQKGYWAQENHFTEKWEVTWSIPVQWKLSCKPWDECSILLHPTMMWKKSSDHRREQSSWKTVAFPKLASTRSARKSWAFDTFSLFLFSTYTVEFSQKYSHNRYAYYPHVYRLTCVTAIKIKEH